MSEWKECRLRDVTHGNGTYGIAASAVPKDENKYTYLRITDINDDGSLNSSDLKSVDDPTADRYLLSPNDIVFARTGNSTGRTYFYDGSAGELVFAGFLIKFSLDPNKVNPKILKYYTHSKEYYDWVASFDSGATRGNINAKTYAEMPIKLPPRNIQDRIVNILSSLDEKIETNRKINARLEELAQALFKSWFIDFEPFGGKMPEDWKTGILSDIANIVMGQSPKGECINSNQHGMIFYQGKTEFGDRFPSVKNFTTNITRVAPVNSVLLSVRAPVGDVNITLNECCIGRGIASIDYKYGSNSFLFLLLKNKTDYFDIFDKGGTVFGCINKKSLEEMPIFLPTTSTIASFNEILHPIDVELEGRSNESSRLAALRDTLLPKLMSGELIPE